jgi:protein ImuA
MKLISCHDGKLHALDASRVARRHPDDGRNAFRTGLDAFDALPPGGTFARGAVHELLHAPGHPAPMFPTAWLAKCAAGQNAVIWSDPAHELYPPALAALGIPLERVFLLHPTSEADQIWALAECLRCRGVSAVVAALPPRQRLTRVEARRLQLAAEQGGGVGLLMRSTSRSSGEHAAVTRWLVRSESGERNVQRWRIQLIFGHGGQVGQSIILEHHRDHAAAAAAAGKPVLPHLTARPVRPPAELADRPAAAREKKARMAAG